MHYRITHTTSYRYSDPVSVCHNEAYLTPRSNHAQRCLSNQLTISPQPVRIDQRSDFFGNTVHYFSLQVPHTELIITAHSEVSTNPSLELPDMPAWEFVLEQLQQDNHAATIMARGFTLTSPFIEKNPTITEYAKVSFTSQRPLLEATLELTERIFEEFTYDPEFTTIVTPLGEVLKHRRGVCQDFAHLAIACLRSLNLPARYVSGYLETLPPPGQTKLQGSDASHAWFSVFVPQLGWFDFDPTNNQRPNEQYITTAWGRDYGDVTPLKGVIFGGGQHQLKVAVDVERCA